jgi:hypothetical protein
MSREDKSWIERNLDLISRTWEPVATAEEADLRITTEQIAIKMFECSPDVPAGTIEMLQERLTDLGFIRGLVTWPEIPNDPNYSRKDNCWAVCWFLKQKTLQQ